jgi:molecular chaperone DnaK
LNIKLTRAKLESLVDDLVTRTIEPCKKAIKDAGIKATDVDEVILVGGMTRMPKVIEIVKNFFGKEPNRSVNPDEVVAAGAAIQGAVIKKDITDVLLLDVTPLSLGIETLGGIFTRLIDKNTTIPTKRSQVFSTAEDNQNAVTIRVFQGEREMAADNKLLGQFNLEGIPPSRRGMPQIEVIFDIDVNGIVHVSAKDKATGKEQKVSIQASGGLSEEEIEKMVKEAEANKEADKVRKELVEVRNNADSLIHTAEKALKDNGDKIKPEDKTAVETAISDLKTSLEGDNIIDIKEKLANLSEASMKIGQNLYNNDTEGSGDGASNDESTESKDEKTVDAEYEDLSKK